MSAEFLTAKAAHKERRRRECAKVEPAMELDPVVRKNALDWAEIPDWRIEELTRKYAPEDAYEPDDYEEQT